MKIKFLLLPLLFSIGFGNFCFADGCDDLIVNVQNTSNTDLYVTFDPKVDSVLLSSHGGALEPLTVSNKGSNPYTSLTMMTSSLKNTARPRKGFLSDDVVSYTEIYKYYTSTGTAGPILIGDPQMATTNPYSYERSFNHHYLHHSTNSLNYKISYKDIYRGNCAKGKPGAITIEIAAISDEE